MVRNCILISIVLLLNSCVLDHKIAMVQTENTSASLRLDGIYVHQDSLNITDLFFLYQDGTILSRGSVHNDDLESKLLQLEHSTNEKYKSMKFLWGRYIIEGNAIKFEKWALSDKPYRTFIREGEILNDTTFIMHTLSKRNGKNAMKINETYRFRQTHSKPDSVNRWVGQRR